MHEETVRELVREALARHLADPPAALAPRTIQPSHPSHTLYVHLVNAGDDCLIEPTVRCNHCGYCKTHGH
jgi:hypothetical protein